MIREIKEGDLQGLLELYLHLHETSVPAMTEHLKFTWKKIIENEDYHLIIAEENGKIVSSCTLVVVPNLTRSASPYGLVENVVTHIDYRGRGFASACLSFAQELAEKSGCYKMMLITGSSNPDTHSFYKKAGYFCEGKTAYYKLLKEVPWNHGL